MSWNDVVTPAGSITMADRLESGTGAPDVSLPARDGSHLGLSSLRGRPVVLCFYPKDDTQGCTTEVCGARRTQVRAGRTSPGLVRSTCLIDAAGRIATVFRSVCPATHADQVLAALGTD